MNIISTIFVVIFLYYESGSGVIMLLCLTECCVFFCLSVRLTVTPSSFLNHSCSPRRFFAGVSSAQVGVSTFLKDPPTKTCPFTLTAMSGPSRPVLVPRKWLISSHPSLFRGKISSKHLQVCLNPT